MKKLSVLPVLCMVLGMMAVSCGSDDETSSDAGSGGSSQGAGGSSQGAGGSSQGAGGSSQGTGEVDVNGNCKKICDQAMKANCENANAEQCMTQCKQQMQLAPAKCKAKVDEFVTCASTHDFTCNVNTKQPDFHKDCDASNKAIIECAAQK